MFQKCANYTHMYIYIYIQQKKTKLIRNLSANEKYMNLKMLPIVSSIFPSFFFGPGGRQDGESSFGRGHHKGIQGRFDLTGVVTFKLALLSLKLVCTSLDRGFL